MYVHVYIYICTYVHVCTHAVSNAESHLIYYKEPELTDLHHNYPPYSIEYSAETPVRSENRFAYSVIRSRIPVSGFEFR